MNEVRNPSFSLRGVSSVGNECDSEMSERVIQEGRGGELERGGVEAWDREF